MERGEAAKFTFIDLFAGIGGFHYALQEHGGEAVWASELMEKAREVYADNHGLMPAGDITKVTAEEIPSHDLIAAGFPCQTFSIAGKGLGFGDPRGTLFNDIARIANYHKPKVLLLENVRNFASHDEGRTLATVRKTFEDLGYNFYSSHFVASDFGVPQARKRYIMVALREDIDPDRSFFFPQPPKTSVALADILEEPSEDTAALKFERDDVQLFPERFLERPKTVNKTHRVGKLNKGRQGEIIYDVRGHAATLSANGGGVGGQTGLYLTDVDGVRKLTPREAARAQGFLESFKIPEPRNFAWKLFGNAVPVPMISHVAKGILDQGYL